MALDRQAVQDAYRATATDRKMVFYGTQLSPHRIQAEEGYILYTGVPIARIGAQEYGRDEVGLDGDGVVDVYRDAADVFDPVTIASFEGKIVTDEHPPVMLDETNVMDYIKGTVHNVRRGTGYENGYLLADLMVYDPQLNEEIRQGKREVSCGYYLDYVEGPDGRIYQKNIRGNHVAIVPKGRAGARVAIKDSQKPETRKYTGGKNMAEKKTIWDRLFGSMAKDADPEDIAELAKIAAAHEAAEKEVPAPAPEAKPEGEPEHKAEDDIAELKGMIRGLLAKLEEEEAKKQGTLEALADEGEPDEYDPEDDEDGVTVVTDEDEVCDEDEELVKAENPVSMDAKRIAKDMLPVLNAIPDAAARKKAKDALYKSLTKAQGKPGKGGAAADAVRSVAKAAADEAAAKEVPTMDAIVEMYAKRNAQYKGDK